jgi:hypothetical protein
MAETEDAPTMKAYSGGITFTGHFPNEAEAWAFVHKIEKDLTLDGGFSNVRGGIKLMDKPLCDCDSASECDSSPGCMFNSFRADDEADD